MDYKKMLEDYFLTGRGIQKHEFFNPQRPFLQNQNEMSVRLRNLINKGRSFRIIGDYDVDGICSTYIMYVGLLQAGAKKVSVRLPDRFTDGYGLSVRMVEETEEDIIITVDNGIAALDAIEEAKAKGKEVLIIDHHEPVMDEGMVVLPKADIIIDHKVYPGCNNDFCGAGLALQVMEELLSNKPWVINKFYIAATLATIADVVDVKNWNRVIIQKGLSLINGNIDVPFGLKKVLEHLSLKKVNTNTLAFRICPILNAPGRVKENGAYISLNLLLVNNWKDATTLKDTVIELNDKRKELTEKGVKQAEEYIEQNCLYGNILPIFLDDTCEGILGIIAGRLFEKYKVPCGVFTNADGNVYKGSFRSEGFHIKLILDVVKANTNSLLKYGGHKQAAGCSILADHKDEFIDYLTNINISRYSTKNEDETTVFCVEACDIEEFYEALEVYEPFGKGNQPPVIKILNMELFPRQGKMYSLMGENDKTIKLFGNGFSAIGFNQYESYLKEKEPKRLNVTGKISKSYYSDTSEIQITFDELEPIDTVVEETSLSKALKDRMRLLVGGN